MIASSIRVRSDYWLAGGPVERLVQRLWASTLDLAALADALEQPIGEADVQRWVQYDTRRYTRTPIACTERFEVRLLGWLPGQGTDLHGHGAACAFRVIGGVATEVRPGAPDRSLAAGTAVLAGPREVHQIENRGARSLLTLHVYAPPPVVGPLEDPRRMVILGGGDAAARLAGTVLASLGPAVHVTLVEPPHARPWDAAVADRICDLVRAGAGRLRVLRGIPRAIRGSGTGVRRVLLDDGRLLLADELILGRDR